MYLGFKNGRNIENIIRYLKPKKQYKLNFIEDNTFFNQQNPDKFIDYLKSENIDYKIVELNSSNINFIYTPHISGAPIQSINRTESIVTKLLLNNPVILLKEFFLKTIMKISQF